MRSHGRSLLPVLEPRQVRGVQQHLGLRQMCRARARREPALCQDGYVKHAQPGAGRWIGRALLGAVLIALLLVGGTGFRVWQVARADERQPADMIVVLGAAQYNGEPSRVLEARLRHAKTLYDEGLAQHVVTVGGRQVGDQYTEAQASRRWLSEHGVPAERIVAVGSGSDTYGSLRAVAAESSHRGWQTALIVSDPWHSLRARLMAEDFGLYAYASPTRSGPTVWTRETQLEQIVRETGALLYYRMTHAPVEVVGLG